MRKEYLAGLALLGFLASMGCEKKENERKAEGYEKKTYQTYQDSLKARYYEQLEKKVKELTEKVNELRERANKMLEEAKAQAEKEKEK